MLYLATTPDDRDFLYHFPTHTLAELCLNAGPGGAHVLYVHLNGHVPEQAIHAFTAWLEACTPAAGENLSIVSRKEFPTPLPEHLILSSASGLPKMLIHYPGLGFTGGIHMDGGKTPPHWKDALSYTPDQRSHILATAAETLITALNRHHRQAT
jgi:hypothetical protein